MIFGPGKYDKLCTLIRDRAHARGACVIVIDGGQGSGFSVQMPLGLYPALIHALRAAADEIEADLRAAPH
jgi:hypothetical protein